LAQHLATMTTLLTY